ncbi:hypothetical protein MMC16_001113 [Acarospora aff. strigata]|nr:hypothetical protein [Acarospora aff. strigata]
MPLCWLTGLALVAFTIARPNSGDFQDGRRVRAARVALPHGLAGRQAGTAPPTPVNTTIAVTAPTSRRPTNGTALSTTMTMTTPAPSVPSPTGSTSSETTDLTFILMTPSTAADISITRLSQVITTYEPQVTMCPLVPLAYSKASNASYPATGGTAPLPTGTGTGNWSMASLTSSCTTFYSATTTAICSTILTGGGQLLTVTDCTQDVTFSTDHGYNLSTTTMLAPESVIRKGTIASYPTMESTYLVPTTTYYQAPWQDVADGIPTHVQAKICSGVDAGNQDCTSVMESWSVTTVPVVQHYTKTIQLTTTLSGGTRVIIDETSTIDVTETVTIIAISTELAASSTVSLPSISTARLNVVPTTTYAPPDTVTYTLESVTGTQHTTITITSTSTSYITVRSTAIPPYPSSAKQL